MHCVSSLKHPGAVGLASAAIPPRGQVSIGSGRTRTQRFEFAHGGVKITAKKGPAGASPLATDRNTELRRIVAETMGKTGLHKLADIAQALNLRGIKTNNGCEFSLTHIHRLLKAA
jgi:hypothetical protein